MLSATLWRAFATPVTYMLLVVLLGTAVMQVRYVNKALQRFDSTQVIPIQFVMFTLSVIIGSAVLYRDFERTTTDQAIKFVGGCLLTFFGVFLVTSGRSRHDDDDGDLSDEEGVEETIGLSEQDGTGDDGIKPNQERRQSDTQTSRRSSRISFAFGPPTMPHESGVASPRKQEAANRTSYFKNSPTETSPLLGNPWDQQSHPGLPSAFSEDSVVTIHSMTSTAIDPQPIDTSLPPHIIAPPSPTERTKTPRPSFSSSRPHSHHKSNSIFSPSPLSSTVSAVVGDTLLRGEDDMLLRKKSIRRMRPSIRSSLYVPYSDEDDQEDGLIQPAETEPRPVTSAGATASNRKIPGRTRSLSNTLGGFFGRKRRNTNPECGMSQDNHEAERGEGSGAGTVV